MPVIYYNIDEMRCLEREPYKTLVKRFKSLENALEEKELEINISDKDGFAKGFYTDSDFADNIKVKFVFSREYENNDDKKGKVFVRMIFSFDCDEGSLYYYRLRIKALKKRIPYFYIPEVTHFAFTTQFDEEISMIFDVLVSDEAKTLQVCCSLLNQIIAVLAFED